MVALRGPSPGRHASSGTRPTTAVAPNALTSFAGHGSLEFAWIVGGKRPAEELTALLDNPSMQLVESSREVWLRADGGWEHVSDIYDMSPEQSRLYEPLQEARWQLMAW